MTGLVRLYKSAELTSFSLKYTDFGSPREKPWISRAIRRHQKCIFIFFTASFFLLLRWGFEGENVNAWQDFTHNISCPASSSHPTHLDHGGGGGGGGREAASIPPLTPPPPPRLTHKPIFYASRLGGKKSSPAQNLPSLIIWASLARTSSVKQTVASRRGYSIFLTACKKRVH